MSITMPEKKQRPAFRPLPALLALLLLGGAFAVYWHISGRVNLAGEVKDSVFSLSPGLSGIFSRVEVREGQRVSKGQPLVILDSTSQRKALAEERQKLAQYEALLPPGHARASAPGGDGRFQERESLEERLARQREEEAAAERRLQSAVADEAQASVLHNRAAVLAAQGKIPARERDAAAAALEDARRTTRAARAAFESYSLARAATVKEIRRVTENQRAVGADALPAGLRIKNYELQQERVFAAEASLEATVVRAPEDGVVTEITARPGGPATAGVPCLFMASFDKGAIVVARAASDVATKLRLNQQCRLEIAGAPDNPYAGHISNFLPGRAPSAGREAESAPPAGMRVEITVTGPAGKALTGTAQPTEGGAPPLYLNGGAIADVTVLLRAPLHARSEASAPRSEESGAAQEDKTGFAPLTGPPVAQPAAPAAPPPVVPAPAATSPLFTPPLPEHQHGADNPQGGAVIHGAGNPEGGVLPPAHASSPSPESSPESSESKHPLPQLPPMQAPAQLTGSPLPDPRNNPSLITPEILEREARSER